MHRIFLFARPVYITSELIRFCSCYCSCSGAAFLLVLPGPVAELPQFPLTETSPLLQPRTPHQHTTEVECDGTASSRRLHWRGWFTRAPTRTTCSTQPPAGDEKTCSWVCFYSQLKATSMVRMGSGRHQNDLLHLAAAANENDDDLQDGTRIPVAIVSILRWLPSSRITRRTRR